MAEAEKSVLSLVGAGISSFVSSFSNIDTWTPQSAGAAMVTRLSGDTGANSAGLVDLTGDARFKFSQGVRQIMSVPLADKIRGVSADIGNLSDAEKAKLDPNYKSWPKGVCPIPVKSAYRTSEEQAQAYSNSEKTEPKPGAACVESGNHVVLDADKMSPELRAEVNRRLTGGVSTPGSRLQVLTPYVQEEYKGDAVPCVYQLPVVDPAVAMANVTPDINLIRRREGAVAALAAAASSPTTPAVISGSSGVPDPSSGVRPGQGTMNRVSSDMKQKVLDDTVQVNQVGKIEVLPVNKSIWDTIGGDTRGSTIGDLHSGDPGRYQDKLDKNATSSGVFATSDPLGYQSKIDVPAQLQIVVDDVASAGAVSPALAAYVAKKIGYIDCFILQSVRAVHEEKSFVFQALNGDATTFFFGNKPSIYSFTGQLIDTYNQQWFNDFEFFYTNYLRGSASLANKTRVFMVYKDQVIEGFMLNAQMSGESNNNDATSFSFDFILVQKTAVNGYRNPIDRVLAAGAGAGSVAGTTQSAATTKAKSDESLLSSAIGASMTTANDFWKTTQSAAVVLGGDAVAALAEIIAGADPTKSAPVEVSKSTADFRAHIGALAANPSLDPSIIVKTNR